jgi:hypothetical protein
VSFSAAVDVQEFERDGSGGGGGGGGSDEEELGDDGRASGGELDALDAAGAAMHSFLEAASDALRGLPPPDASISAQLAGLLSQDLGGDDGLSEAGAAEADV